MNIARTPKERLYFLVAKYFKFWANISFKRWKPKVVAITGSTGKTTLLQLLDAQLSGSAHFSHDANSIYGISFDILGLTGVKTSRLEWLKLAVAAPLRAFTYTRTDAIYIVEIDAGRPNGARLIANWLRPAITALTGIEESHAEFYQPVIDSGKFKTHLDAITDEFMSIPRATSDIVIINDADTVTRNAIKTTADTLPKTIVALSEKDYLKSYAVSARSTKFDVASGEYLFSYPLPRAIWLQLAMCEKIVEALGLTIKSHDLTTLQFPAGRSSVFDGVRSTTLIDSSYNAQLSSMIATLDMFDSIKASPKWVVLSDIIELGESTAEQHQALARYLSSYKADHILLVGRRTAKYIYPTLQKNPAVSHFSNAHELLDFMQKNISGGETILFKGSQHLEWVIGKLLKNPETDTAKLPRQSPADIARLRKLGYL